jgi:hypothetical protein
MKTATELFAQMDAVMNGAFLLLHDEEVSTVDGGTMTVKRSRVIQGDRKRGKKKEKPKNGPGSPGRVEELRNYYTSLELFTRATGETVYRDDAGSPFDEMEVEINLEKLSKLI